MGVAKYEEMPGDVQIVLTVPSRWHTEKARGDD